MVKIHAEIIIILLGSTLFHLLRLNFISSADTPCEYQTVGQNTIANCSKKGVENVPKDLQSNIWSLDISYNKITNINEASFDPYQGLVQLRMIEMDNYGGKSNALQPNAFQKLTKLEYLDMTKSQHSESSDFYWPTSLKILIVNSNNFKKLNMENLSNLEEIYANGNSIGDFPRFHDMAPLKVIEMEKNPIKTVLVVEIAPFCELHTFMLTSTPKTNLQAERNYCDCKRMQIWLKTFAIKCNPLECTVPAASNDEVGCDVGFYEFEVTARNKCLARLPKRYIYFIAAGVAILVILLLAGVLVYLFVIPPKPKETTHEEVHEEGGTEAEATSEEE